MKYPITIEALEVLDAIDRKGSFAAAANALYRVPSAITYTVQKLEQDLGVSLFRKQGRQSKLSPAGKVLLEQGREILAASQRLVINTKQADSGWEPSLSIAIDSILDFEFIYPLIEQFYNIQPDIEINLYEEVLAGAWETILNDQCDLVIGASDTPPQGKGIKSLFLINTDWVFAVAQDHPLTQMPRPLNKADIEQHRFVVVRDTARYQAALNKRLFTTKPVLRVPTLAAKIRAQLLGIGVGFLPRHRIQGLLDSGELVALAVDQLDEVSAQYIGWKAANKGKALSWFREQVLQHFQKQAFKSST